MKKLFRWEVWGALAAGVAAGFSYRAGILYLPSVFIIVMGFLIMGMFAALEDELLERRHLPGIGSHDIPLVLPHSCAPSSCWPSASWFLSRLVASSSRLYQ